MRKLISVWHRLHRCSNFGQMSWSSVESCRAFHKLSIEYKIIKIGVRSKELWPKYEVLWKLISGSTGSSGDHRLHRCSNFGQMRWSSTKSCREFHKLSIEYKIVENGVRSKELYMAKIWSTVKLIPLARTHRSRSPGWIVFHGGRFEEGRGRPGQTRQKRCCKCNQLPPGSSWRAAPVCFGWGLRALLRAAGSDLNLYRRLWPELVPRRYWFRGVGLYRIFDSWACAQPSRRLSKSCHYQLTSKHGGANATEKFETYKNIWLHCQKHLVAYEVVYYSN